MQLLEAPISLAMRREASRGEAESRMERVMPRALSKQQRLAVQYCSILLRGDAEKSPFWVIGLLRA